MFNMRNKQYTLPWLLIILCFPVAASTPPLGGADTIAIEAKKDQNSWDECKELLKKAKEKKLNKKDSTEKKDK